jgi:hypothetical protein
MHYPIYRKCFTPKSRQNVRYVRNFKNFNATDFLDDLSPESEVNEAFNYPSEAGELIQACIRQ